MAELPVAEFLRTRLKEYDSKFEVRKGSAFDDFFFKTMQFVLQPLRDEADQLFIGQSLRRILKTDNPDAFDEELVDDLVANFFVYRIEGSKSSGVARVYYDTPVYREYPAGGFAVTGNNGETYTNPAVYLITDGQMSSQVENGLYYMDVPIVSNNPGLVTELEPESLVTVIDDPDYISVTNKYSISGGTDREKNTDLINRAKQAITVRDLVTGKGFQAILFENFPNSITEVQAIGFGDEEMMRDIVFNTHIGGKHDGYVKTPSIKTTDKDFLGVLIDSTRATRTTTQVNLPGTSWVSLGQKNVDRTVAGPVVQQVKSSVAAYIEGAADLSNPIDLSTKTTVKITIDSTIREVRVAGVVPGSTSRSEIINNINIAFGVNVAFAYDRFIRLVSPNPGLSSRVEIDTTFNPALNAYLDVFGVLFLGYISEGDGPITFAEDIDYTINNTTGEIKRIVGSEIISLAASKGVVDGAPHPLTIPDGSWDIIWADPAFYPGMFASVLPNDIVSITGAGTIDGDYRVIEVLGVGEAVVIDTVLPSGAPINLDGKFRITRTGIKNNELVFVDFYYNPLSIDIGKFIVLDTYGRSRGIRPGREEMTITDVAFLRINSIDVIDPVTGEPLGTTLQGIGGYGRGGYGGGAYGIGAGSDYRLVINEPTARFSAFEDAYIVISSAFEGMSLRVNYDYVPEIEAIHDFCRSDAERVLDGDVLIKHFIPAYVSGTITYEADNTDSSIPTNEELTAMVKDYINGRRSGTSLQLSDVSQFILKTVDPNYKYLGSVKPFTLSAIIYNTDGTSTMIESSEALVVPKEDPFPKETTRPLSPRITHWVADNIELVRV